MSTDRVNLFAVIPRMTTPFCRHSEERSDEESALVETADPSLRSG
jgi:hypothetical protein